MPSFTIHLAVAKKYLEAHQEENEEEFYNGVIDPDLKDKKTSHYGQYSSTPDLNRYCREVGLNSSYNRGYFLHLLTDDLFYNKYLERFSTEIYNDYNKINRAIVDRYGIEMPDKIKDLVRFESGETRLLDFDSICKFIDTVGNIDLENYKQSKMQDEQEQETK